MGLFDIFRSNRREASASSTTATASTGVGAKPAAPSDRKVQGPAKVVSDKRAQGYDRLDAIQQLSDLRSAEAAVALLKRFSFSADPSISDQEEKEFAFRGILETVSQAPEAERERRREEILDGIRAFSSRAEQLSWPIKLLKELLPGELYTAELLRQLGTFDTEYSRTVEPKVQLLAALEELRSSSIAGAVERFLDDANETVRFHAVQTLFAQASTARGATETTETTETREACLPALLALLRTEESVRIKNRIAEGLAVQAWQLPEEERDGVRLALRDTGRYGLDDQGRVQRF